MAILNELGQWFEVIFMQRRSIAGNGNFRHIISIAACHFFGKLGNLPVLTIIGGAG
ncbi:hypothetical protein LR1_05250 [Lacticaseibacillus rhamnosus DSM 20021 = JCM 1136 = NBRC 3425]|nr:hypothetical protein LR1_05250 [Lacticaseibacillus rhamnosus DSM 20021 = JCM 1136 = NBRC 3425]